MSLPGFQQYLIDKGFKRTCINAFGERVEDNESVILSTYNPLQYNFNKGGKSCYWGLSELKKPAVIYLGAEKMSIIQNPQNIRTKEDGYRILFSKWKDDGFDLIFDVFMSENKYFEIDCTDEENILIQIKTVS